jgi:hypothetical protein
MLVIVIEFELIIYFGLVVHAFVNKINQENHANRTEKTEKTDEFLVELNPV